MGYKIIMEAGAGVLSKAQLDAQSKWSNDIERVSRWTKWLLIKQLLPQPRSVFYALCWPSKHHPINHLWLDKDGKKRKWKTKVEAPKSENLKSGNSMKSPRAVLVKSWKFEVFTFFLTKRNLFSAWWPMMVAGNDPTYCWCQHLFIVAFIDHHRRHHFRCCYVKSLCHRHRYRPRHRCCHWSLMWSRIANGGHWGHAAQMTYQSLFLPPCSFLPRWWHIIMMVMNRKAKEMDEIIFTTNIRGMWL